MAPPTDNPAADSSEPQEVKLDKAAPVESATTTESHGDVAANGAATSEHADAEQTAVEVKADAPAENSTGRAEEKKPAAQDAPAADDKTSADKQNGDKRDRDNHKNKYAGRKDDGRRDNRGRTNKYQRSKGRDVKPKVNEFENLPETDDPDAIRDQVEFYFSVQNLKTDKHLFKEIDGPDNRAVPIKHIHTFKRMRRFQPYSAIVRALRDSQHLDVVEDGSFSRLGDEGVKRKIPLQIPGWDREEDPDASIDKLSYMLERYFRNNQLERSIYAKGFGNEHTGQIELENFFKPFGAFMVRKRRYPDTGEWKGSVFVEFDSEETQAAFLALDPKPKFHGLELEVIDKKAYSTMKCEQKGIVPSWDRDEDDYKPRYSHHGQDRARNYERSGGRGSSRGRGRGGRGGRGQRGGNRGGRGGRRNDSRSRSPRGSEDEDRDDWNSRRNKFQNKGKGHNKGRRDDRDRDEDREEKDDGLNRDENGVPGIADTRKRKADDDEKENSPKKAKVEITEDA